MKLEQITIVGTGLIGGSLGLALKSRGFTGRIVGCDKPEVLAHGMRIGAIDEGRVELRESVRGSDVVLLATPVGAVLDLIEQLGPVLPENVLLTDVGSTKTEVVDRARAVFGQAAKDRFLAGHPMAGKENGGIENADADLLEGAVWLVTPLPGQNFPNDETAAIRQDGPAGREPSATKSAGMNFAAETGASNVETWLALVRKVGARVLVMDATRHDQLCAWVSHLPQMLATALAASIEDEFGDDADVHAIGGRALSEMTRIAASPYSMWRDIALTNTANIEEALMSLEQRLAHVRESLRTRALQEEFEKGNRFRKS